MGTLSSILESCMLLCFGASWPLSVIKNYKAKSAKAMSLPFILLIVIGYICGIIAKFAGLSAGKTTPIYVFVVYFFNLIVVSINASAHSDERSSWKNGHHQWRIFFIFLADVWLYSWLALALALEFPEELAGY